MKQHLKKILYIFIVLFIVVGIILIIRPHLIEHLQLIRTNKLIENFENGEIIVNENEKDIVSILLKILGEYEGSGYDSFDDDEFIFDENSNVGLGIKLLECVFSRALADEKDQISIIGKIEIPGFGKNGVNAIMDSTSTQALKLGVCHLEGTSMPGELGNCVILGHRTSNQFYHVNCFIDVEGYDRRVIITDSKGYTYIYEASSYKSVPVKEVWTALEENKIFDYQLTLLTCSPKTPPEGQRRTKRLLVFCNLIETIPPVENISSD